jgi:hypothetical protein
MPPPTLIKVVFLIFPIGVVTMCITLFIWFDPIMNPFLAEVFNIMHALQEGSFIWDQLRISSTSTEEKYKLVTNLTKVLLRAESLGPNVRSHLQNLANSLMVLQSIILALVCIAALVRPFI